MCRTAHALLQTIICGVQMLVRVFMTVILMIENLIRMVLQTLYNFISFMLQMISLIPICLVFMLTARLKCFMCGGGGPCPVNRGGTCDCLMSAVAIIILFLIFRATGVLDKIFYKIGYVKARPLTFTRFVPTPGDITECSRNDSMYDLGDVMLTFTSTGDIEINPVALTEKPNAPPETTTPKPTEPKTSEPETPEPETPEPETPEPTTSEPTTPEPTTPKTTTLHTDRWSSFRRRKPPEATPPVEPDPDAESVGLLNEDSTTTSLVLDFTTSLLDNQQSLSNNQNSYNNWTTVLYYLV